MGWISHYRSPRKRIWKYCEHSLRLGRKDFCRARANPRSQLSHLRYSSPRFSLTGAAEHLLLLAGAGAPGSGSQWGLGAKGGLPGKSARQPPAVSLPFHSASKLLAQAGDAANVKSQQQAVSRVDSTCVLLTLQRFAKQTIDSLFSFEQRARLPNWNHPISGVFWDFQLIT